MNTEDVVKLTRRLVIAVLIACGAAQYNVDDSLQNTTCAFIAVVGSVSVVIYTLSLRRFRRAPMSCLMVLGFNVSALSGALVTQSAYLRPITYNLDVPLQTFSALALAQSLVIVVHFVYDQSRALQALRQSISRYVYQPIGLLEPPSALELGIFGFLGCAATMLAAQNYREAVQFGDVSSKFAQGFIPFAVAPFLIPMRSYILVRESGRKQSNWLFLTCYTAMLIAVAMANNARATFSSGFLTLGLCCLVTVLSGNYSLTHRKIAVGLLGMCLAVPCFLTLSDLATAMVIARDERSNVTSMELIEITLNNFQDKQLLEDRRHRDATILGGDYNENYVSNPIFARFVYTKFVDVNMYNALNLSDSQVSEIRKQTINRIISLLPTPVINYLGIKLEKADLEYSSGDLYSFIARGLGLGSYTTGSEIPDGLTIFGVVFWPVLAVLVLVQYIVYDAFSKIDHEGRFRISALALLNAVPVFTLGVMQESVSNQIMMILRGIPQLIVLYWLLRLMTSVVSSTMRLLNRLGAPGRSLPRPLV